MIPSIIGHFFGEDSEIDDVVRDFHDAFEGCCSPGECGEIHFYGKDSLHCQTTILGDLGNNQFSDFADFISEHPALQIYAVSVTIWRGRVEDGEKIVYKETCYLNANYPHAIIYETDLEDTGLGVPTFCDETTRVKKWPFSAVANVLHSILDVLHIEYEEPEESVDYFREAIEKAKAEAREEEIKRAAREKEFRKKLFEESRRIELEQNSKPELRKRSEFHMKVAGVTFEGRQRVVARLQIGQKLSFVPEPTNPYDSQAVKIMTLNGEMVGHVPRDRNSDIFRNLMNGFGKYEVTVSNVTGGGFNTRYGCNIKVEYYC